ncbi:MAG: Secreted protein with beta-propeller repeat domain containing protein [Candidatus Methanohalarchaeum thermophilum]|uniref:Secreted protein with beta-propeller repeat domain containing protein n=1 Tax=Methanohalarchaeum thermophilum TaxID=1903181 RepID=A0A1Q6DV69_METT1|nr:MAG: Secreted protein with beta-propeller repeat domain containing protein [Candidatus Methanohalarchaeum thermophilum]
MEPEELFEEEKLIIPDQTKIEQKLIVTDSDVYVGGRSKINYGIKSNGSISVGERAKVDGRLAADGDVNIGFWSVIGGDLEAGEDAYIGERSKIDGELTVGNNLDIGNDVEIEDGFEANGWITIRDPIPLFVYFIMILSDLVRRGGVEEVDEFFEEVDEENEVNLDSSLVIPENTIFDSEISSPNHIEIGENCRFVGNLRGNEVDIGDETTLFGGIKAKEDINIGKNTDIHGNIETKKKVHIEEGAKILGDIKAEKVKFHRESHINGKINAKEVSIFPKEDLDEIKENEISHELIRGENNEKED